MYETKPDVTERRNRSTVKTEDFLTPFSAAGKMSWQKMSKNIELNNTMPSTEGSNQQQ